MKKGTIIWLNGVSSVGKSTLTADLQKSLLLPYFCISQDTFTSKIAPWLSGNYNGIDAETLWYTAVKAMYNTIKLYSDMGLNVIVDHIVLNQDDGKEQQIFDECMQDIRGYPLVMVKVSCGLDELRRREIARGDRDLGSAEEQLKQGLYPHDGYDVVIDTSVMPKSEYIQRIADAVIN